MFVCFLCVDCHRIVGQADHAGDAGVDARAEFALLRLGQQIAGLDTVAGLDHGHRGNAGMLLQRQGHLARRELVRGQRADVVELDSPRREISRVIGTRRNSAMGWGMTDSGVPVKKRPLARAAGLDSTQTFLGSRSSGQAYMVHRLHSQQ